MLKTFEKQNGLKKKEGSAQLKPVLRHVQPSQFVEQIASFSDLGQPTLVEHRNEVPYLINEYWTARQRQAHSIHEISYRACFKPQLPEFFISRLTNPKNVVLDPFMGRGTTPIQASLMGRKAIGVDVNPLSSMLTKPRFKPPCIKKIAKRLSEINWKGKLPELPSELLVFYHPDTLKEICLLREWIAVREHDGNLDEVDEWIRMVALNRMTGHSPGFFSVYTLPPNQATTLESQAKINAKRNQVPERRSVPAILLKKSGALLKDGGGTQSVDFRLYSASANAMSGVHNGEVDLVVTSPPFMDMVQYAKDNWLRCWFAGIDITNVSISIYKKKEHWTEFIESVLHELSRVVRPGGYVAFEVGEIRQASVDLDALVLNAAKKTPLNPVCVLINSQNFTKTSNCWGVFNNRQGTNSNRIVVFSKD